MFLICIPWLTRVVCVIMAVWGVCDGSFTLNEHGSSTVADILMLDFQQ